MSSDRACVGDILACEVQNPQPATIAMRLLTPGAVAHANKLLADEQSGWRLIRAAASMAPAAKGEG